MLKYSYLLFAVAVLLPFQDVSPQAWNMFRGNQALHGFVEEGFPREIGIMWTFATLDEIKTSPVIADDKIVIGSTDGNVYCLDLQGRLKWKFVTGTAIEGTALILDGNVVVGNLYGTLYSLNLENGEKNWEFTAENQFSGAPNYWKNAGNTYILIGSYDYYLYCIDAKNGSVIWKYEANNYINGAVSLHNDKAIFGGCDGLLHIVDIKTGKADEMIEIATYVAGSPSIVDNVAFIGDYDGGFTAADLISKKIKWKWTNETTNLPFIASPSVYQDKIVVGNRDKFVYCFNKSNGEVIWKYNTGNKVDASCVISTTNVLVGNMRGDIIMLDLENGKPVWNYELGSPVYSNPVVVNDKIIVGAGDGTIYCLGNK